MGPSSTAGGTIIALTLLLMTLSQQAWADLGINEDVSILENRLRPILSYLIVAPRLVRPDQLINVYVSIFRITGPSMTVSLSVRSGQVEYAMRNEVYDRPGSRLLQMQMLPTAEPGNYTLRVEGTVGKGTAGTLFVNETEIIIHPKRVSCFIQTDKPIYKMKNVVRFRVIAITANRLPVRSGTITIYVKDGKGVPVRRWIGREMHSGVFESSVRTTDPMRYGWWTIEVHGWGYVYSQRFRMEGYYPELFYVNVSMPSYVKEGEYALAGIIIANLTTCSHIIEGNATVRLEVEPPGSGKRIFVTEEEIPHFKGVSSFLFRLDDIRSRTHKFVGTKLLVTATVFDFHHQMEQSWTQTAVVYDNLVRLRYLGDHVRVFRPGLPFNVYVAAYESDGSPLSRLNGRTLNIERLVQKKKAPLQVDARHTAIIPDDSIVKYSFIPDGDVTMIVVRATYQNQKGTTIELVATRHYTKSGVYLTIATSTHQPEVNKYIVFTLRASIWVPEVHYMVISRGQILLANAFPMTSRQKTFSIATSRDMVPEARMLVYCVLMDGEVLADSVSVHIKDLGFNNISVTTNKGKDFSGRTLEITAQTLPGSFIAFSSMQYDIYLRGGNRDTDGNVFFTRNSIEDELLTYDPLANHSFSHTWLMDEHRQHRVHYNAPSYAIDANLTFTYSGLMLFTDAHLTRIPGIWDCNDTLGFEPCFTGGCYHKSQRCDKKKDCIDLADEMGCDNPERKPASPPDEFMAMQRMWYYFDAVDWAWANYYTKPTGNIEFQVKMPVRATTWVIGAFALHPEIGLVFTEHPTRLDTTKPFYIVVDVAPLAVKGEQLGVRVTAFNYWHQPIEALLTLPQSDKYAFVNVDDEKKISSYNPRISQTTIQTMVYLWPGTERFVFFPVLPLVIGKVDITIIAESPVNRQVVTKTVTVRWNGVTNTYHTPYFINLVSQGSVIIPDLEIPVDERFWDPELRQILYVPGSASVKVSVVGDVMGPGLVLPTPNVEKITGYGEGHGSSYIFTFAMNVYWLKFLRATNQLKKSEQQQAFGSMLIALESIVSYIRPSGGIGMRRGRGTEGVWLSAYALETLAVGSDPEWEETIYVDVRILNEMASYIVSQQNMTTGAFSWVTKPLDRKFEPVLFAEDGTPLNVSLTAYVSIALAKSLGVLTGDAQRMAEESKNLAADYLALQLDKINDPFQMCLVTYALYVTNHRMKGQAFKLMKAMRREDNYVYWSPVRILRDPVEIVNTVPFQYPRPTTDVYNVKAIHATAYALMVYLLNNKFEEAEPIMIWLQLQRYTEHGWAGPQETLMALQALKEYGERLPNRELYQMWVTLESTGNAGWMQRIKLEKGNFNDYRQFRVSTVFQFTKNVYGSIKASATGTGLTLLQVQTEVNVEYPFQLRNQWRQLCLEERQKSNQEGQGMVTIGGYQCRNTERSDAGFQTNSTRGFDLEVDKLLFYGRNSSHILYNICMRWVRTDISPVSGAAILEVEMPSGFFVIRSYLNKLIAAGPKNQHRARSFWHKVIVYYDYIGPRQCFEFRAQRWYPVANASIQHRVRVYDTFNPGFQNSTLYTTYTLFHLHICQVCGSFQCPYSPYYNKACSLMDGPLSAALLIAVAIFVCRRLGGLAASP